MNSLQFGPLLGLAVVSIFIGPGLHAEETVKIDHPVKAYRPDKPDALMGTFATGSELVMTGEEKDGMIPVRFTPPNGEPISALCKSSSLNLKPDRGGEETSSDTSLVEWTTDYDEALERAKSDDKCVLLYFTVSDLNSQCILFSRNVLSSLEFNQYVRDRAVLVKIDLPSKMHIPDELKERNQKLLIHYDVSKYPTLVILDPRGKKIGSLGYIDDDADHFMKELKSYLD